MIFSLYSLSHSVDEVSNRFCMFSKWDKDPIFFIFKSDFDGVYFFRFDMKFYTCIFQADSP